MRVPLASLFTHLRRLNLRRWDGRHEILVDTESQVELVRRFLVLALQVLSSRELASGDGDLSAAGRRWRSQNRPPSKQGSTK